MAAKAEFKRLDASGTDAPGRGDGDAVKPKECACGCKTLFFPKRDHGKYFGNHRKRVWVAKHSGALAIARLEKEVESLKHRVKALEARLMGAAGQGKGARPGGPSMGGAPNGA